MPIIIKSGSELDKHKISNDLYKRILISSDMIQARVHELAQQLSIDYAGKNPLLITVLKGAFIFLADLVRNLSIPHDIDFIPTSMLGKDKGKHLITKDSDFLRFNVEGRDIIIIENVIDTGQTLANLVEILSDYKLNSLKICLLISKSTKPCVNLDYVGFTIPDVFVVGYGLDFQDQFRNQPYISELLDSAHAEISEKSLHLDSSNDDATYLPNKYLKIILPLREPRENIRNLISALDDLYYCMGGELLYKAHFPKIESKV